MKINKIVSITEHEHQVQFGLISNCKNINDKNHLARIYTINSMQEYQLIGEYPINIYGEIIASFSKNISANHRIIAQVFSKETKPIIYSKQADVDGDDSLLLELVHKSYWHDNCYYKADRTLAKSEWVYDNDYERWFYIDESGQYCRNQWVQGYYLRSDGQMAQNEWIHDRNMDKWYFVGENGHYLANQWKDGSYLQSNGEVAKEEWIFDQDFQEWFYVDSTGHFVQDSWVDGYYLDAMGIIAKNKWIHDGHGWRYLKADGHYARDEMIKGYYIPADGYFIK